jgi:hypothetical protein
MSAQREQNLTSPRTPLNLLIGTAGVSPAMSAQREQDLLQKVRVVTQRLNLPFLHCL